MMNPPKPSRRRRRKPPPQPLPPDDHAAPPDPPPPPPPRSGEGKDEAAVEDAQSTTLEWLTGAFSSASLADVESARLAARGDAYCAAGILAGRGMGAAGRRRGKAVAATGMVANVIGKGYAARTARGGSAGKREERRKGEVGGEMEEFLFGMMGEGCELDIDVVKDVLVHCGYDLEKAVDKLLDISNCTVSRFKNCATDMFQEGFPADYNNIEDKLSDKTAESSSGTSESDFDSQYPACSDYGNEACHGCMSEEQLSFSWANKQDLQKKLLLSLFSIPDYSQRDPKLMDWKKVVKNLESFGQGMEFSVASSDDTNSYDSKEQAKEDFYHRFRGTASQHWVTMKDYYQKAAIAYSKGDRAHASYLSEQGRHFNKLAQEADEKASREIFEARNKGIQNEITIDLHGQHVKQAMRLLKLHLLIFTYTPSIQLLRVITGSGSHGVGKGKLKHSVMKLATREGIQWREENAGTILMKVDSSKVYSFIEADDDDDDDI